MPNCYKCGAIIPPGQGKRQSVKIGRSISKSLGRRNYSSSGRRDSGSTRIQYGERFVCNVCNKKSVISIFIGVIVILLLIAFFGQNHNTESPEKNTQNIDLSTFSNEEKAVDSTNNKAQKTPRKKPDQYDFAVFEAWCRGQMDATGFEYIDPASVNIKINSLGQKPLTEKAQQLSVDAARVYYDAVLKRHAVVAMLTWRGEVIASSKYPD